MWIVLMLIILLTNGMSSYGLKVISAWGLPGETKYPYLAIWYGAGFVLIGVPLLMRRFRLKWQESLWGSAVALLSIGGQVAMGGALGQGLPGSVVFPVTIGGSMLVVAVAGRFLFKEKLHPLSWSGVTIGFVAIVLLSLG
jgi:multidrug transporter EmrE-like cation transporter